jgi:7-cyano-7-deazaguanine synthase
MIDSVAIVSGGMDSVTLLHYLVRRLGRTPAVLTFTYGQKHSKEVSFARAQAGLLSCAEHLLLDLSPLAPAFASSALVSPALAIPDMAAVQGDPQPPTYVPNRNMIFLAIAAALAEARGADLVYYGAQRHDLYGYWDTTPQFVDQINTLLALNRKTTVRVETPFVHFSKADILRLGFELGVDYALTWSCYEGGAAACGVCPTCAERLQAFAEVGRSDPLPYTR